MIKALAIFAAITMAACSLNAPQPGQGEVIVSGIWSGHTIHAGSLVFNTSPIGVKGIAVQVQIIEHDGHWYTWAPGYGTKIEKVGELL